MPSVKHETKSNAVDRSGAQIEELAVSEILDRYARNELTDEEAVKMLEKAHRSRHGVFERLASHAT